MLYLLYQSTLLTMMSFFSCFRRCDKRHIFLLFFFARIPEITETKKYPGCLCVYVCLLVNLTKDANKPINVFFIMAEREKHANARSHTVNSAYGRNNWSYQHGTNAVCVFTSWIKAKMQKEIICEYKYNFTQHAKRFSAVVIFHVGEKKKRKPQLKIIMNWCVFFAFRIEAPIPIWRRCNICIRKEIWRKGGKCFRMNFILPEHKQQQQQ